MMSTQLSNCIVDCNFNNLQLFININVNNDIVSYS